MRTGRHLADVASDVVGDRRRPRRGLVAQRRVDVDPPLVPELPAARQVWAWLERLGTEAGEQRERRDHGGAVRRHEGSEAVEVGEVAAPPAALAVQRERRRSDAESAPRVVEAAARPAARSCEHVAGRLATARRDHEAVVAGLELGGELERRTSAHAIGRRGGSGPREHLAVLGRELALEGAPDRRGGERDRPARTRGHDLARAHELDRAPRAQLGERGARVARGVGLAHRLEHRDDRVVGGASRHLAVVDVRDEDAPRPRKGSEVVTQPRPLRGPRHVSSTRR